jgi:hypothetical protein
MKFVAIVLLCCSSLLAVELPLNFHLALLMNLPPPAPISIHLPDPNIVVAAPEFLPVEPPPPIFPKNTHALIHALAQRHGVPAAFIKSIVAAESNFDQTAVSPKGAIGLMQLMPDTAQQFGADPKVPEQNLEAGTRYLRMLMDRYRKCRDRMRRVIAAYNAGPGVVDRYRGVPPYPETRAYVGRVLTFMRYFQRQPGAAALIRQP